MQKARVKGKIKLGCAGRFTPRFADVARRGEDIFFGKTAGLCNSMAFSLKRTANYDHADWPSDLKPALNLIELFDEMEKAEKKYETERFDEGINAGESRIFAQISNNTGNILVRIQQPHHDEMDISLSKADFRKFCMQGLGLTKEAGK